MLRSFAEKRPQDPFPRYALAMEHQTAGAALAAWETLAALIADHPDYVAAYAPAAAALCALGRKHEAREVYSKGIAAAERRKDPHARSHLETMLAALDADG
jgi:predicted Zn-dependent protease